MKTTAPGKDQGGSLYMTLELREKKWKLGFTVGLGQRARIRTIPGSDGNRLLEEIQQARQRLGLSETAPEVSCSEAGREGFWAHRFLTQQGIQNWVVDSSSIEVNCKARRVKSGRLDAAKLAEMLVRCLCGRGKCGKRCTSRVLEMKMIVISTESSKFSSG